MKFLIILSLVVAIAVSQDLPQPGACGVASRQAQTTSRIVNGETAVPNSWPWQLLLVGFFPNNNTAKHYCGASLISKTHIMTAAHCVKDYAANDICLYPGLHYFPKTIVKADGIPLSKFYTHESYSPSGLSNDIAIGRLTREIKADGDKVAYICLPEKSADQCAPGNPVVATGWGSMTGAPNRTSASRPEELQQVQLKCVANTEKNCKTLTHTFGLFNDKSKMCAHEPGKSVCFGDSGGPLCRQRSRNGVIYYEQVGIMSGTIDCSHTKPMPDVYANVRELSDWAKNKVKISL